MPCSPALNSETISGDVVAAAAGAAAAAGPRRRLDAKTSLCPNLDDLIT